MSPLEVLMPRLSVLLPARNAQNTVGEAVSSTLRALPRDAELVVLDDGSTDATAARAADAGRGDARLRVESQPPSGGIAVALNWLLAHTDSELVGRMDADDITLPWRFRSALPALGRGADIVFNQVLYTTGARTRPAVPLGITPAAFGLHLLLTNPVSHPAMVATRAVLDSVRGYRAVPAEDYDLWMRAVSAGFRLRRLGVWGLKYRVPPDQITASTTWRSASWDNADQAEAFGDLSAALVGERLTRIVTLAQHDASTRERELAHFADLIRTAGRRLGPVQHAALEHRLRSRLAWARDISA